MDLRTGKSSGALDVYIKHEGYAAVKFMSPKAKQWACNNRIPNSLDYFGKEFCGSPVWNPETPSGLYNCSLSWAQAAKLTKRMRKEGFIVESERDERE